MSKIGIIIGREYLSRVKKKSFIILTLLTPVIFVGIILMPLLLSTVKGDKQHVIAVNDPTEKYFSRLEGSDIYQFVSISENISTLPQERHEDFDAFVSIQGNLADSTGLVRFYSVKQVGMDMQSFVMRQLESISTQDKIASYNIPQLEQILDNIDQKLKSENVLWGEDGKEKKTSSEISMAIGMAATLLIYMFIFIYGSMVMNGVIEEKQNRIVEIIVSSVKPFYLMMGKIIGIALVGLTQFVLWILLIAVFCGVAVGVAGIPMEAFTQTDAMMSGMNAAQMNIDTNTLETIQLVQSFHWGEIIMWFILYFLAGYLLYASMFASIGAAVDNNEDSSQFVLPITFIVLFALYAGIYGAMNPEGPLLMWCSFIPFTSPIVMMVRLPFGVPVWQLLLSYALLIGTFILMVKIAAKIYRTGILMYGKKVTYKDLWKWLTYRN